MTDPTRELIDHLRQWGGSGTLPELQRAAADALQSRIAEVGRLTEALDLAKACLGAGFGDHPNPAIRESNVNQAWHYLDAALSLQRRV